MTIQDSNFILSYYIAATVVLSVYGGKANAKYFLPMSLAQCLAQVAFSEERSSFLSFLTSVCAIVGGVFTVSGILDSFVFHGSQVIRKKKVDLGKFS